MKWIYSKEKKNKHHLHLHTHNFIYSHIYMTKPTSNFPTIVFPLTYLILLFICLQFCFPSLKYRLFAKFVFCLPLFWLGITFNANSESNMCFHLFWIHFLCVAQKLNAFLCAFCLLALISLYCRWICFLSENRNCRNYPFFA